MKVKSLSHVRPSATPWTAAFQALPSMGFARQEYWSGVPLPSPLRMTELTKDPLRAQLVKNPTAMQETLVRFLDWKGPLEKGLATHSSILGLPLWLSQ